MGGGGNLSLSVLLCVCGVGWGGGNRAANLQLTRQTGGEESAHTENGAALIAARNASCDPSKRALRRSVYRG